ncbi:hypothetical protein BOTCAL_0017g00130 [Botryotinia calthae]|uniref:Uncharacterized protein n=1 Tax=Botryotinia calthae TaxID=38488 RepID=A0A4Y8DHU1_9HELO|nr:hypothetical protein BOTCAL_0017g00130 [Botryotinia calthae]
MTTPKTYVLSRNRLCFGTEEDAKHRDVMERDGIIDCPMNIASVAWNVWTASKVGMRPLQRTNNREEWSKLYSSILQYPHEDVSNQRSTQPSQHKLKANEL